MTQTSEPTHLDELYLNELKQDTNYKHFLEFCITINLAGYAGYWTVSKSEYTPSFYTMGLLLILFVLNLGIYMIYTRQHYLKQGISLYVRKNLSPKLRYLSRYLEKQDHKKNQGITWLVLKILFSFLTTIPLSLLIYYMITSISLCFSLEKIVSTILSLLFFYFCLQEKFYDYLQEVNKMFKKPS